MDHTEDERTAKSKKAKERKCKNSKCKKSKLLNIRIILVHPKDNVEDSKKTSTIKPKAIVKFKERFQNAFYLHALLNYPMLMIYRAHT